MKKTFFILLAIVYLASSAGATVQLHYCMNKLVGIDMHGAEHEMCAKCGMKKQQGCCKDESKQIKVNDDQKPASKFVLHAAVNTDAGLAYVIQHSTFLVSKDFYFKPLTNAPPNGGTDRYLYLRVFRI